MTNMTNETITLSRSANRETALASLSDSAMTGASSYLQVESMMSTSM